MLLWVCTRCCRRRTAGERWPGSGTTVGKKYREKQCVTRQDFVSVIFDKEELKECLFIVFICFNLQLIFLGFLQSEESGAPGHKCSSFAGAAGLGHEPKPPDIPSPGCRCNPGEASCVETHLCLKHLLNKVDNQCRLQVEAGSRTVLAVMGEENTVNNVTGSLKLL